MTSFTKGNLELRAAPGGLGGIISQLIVHDRTTGTGAGLGITDDPETIPEPSRRMAGSRETIALPALNCTMTVVLKIGEQVDVLRIRVVEGRTVERIKLKLPRAELPPEEPEKAPETPTGRRRGSLTKKKPVGKKPPAKHKPVGKKRMHKTE